MVNQVFYQLLSIYHWEIRLVVAHAVLHRRIDHAVFSQLLELRRAQCHLSSFEHECLVLDLVHSRGVVTCYVRAAPFEPDFGHLEAECNHKADHVTCDREVPDEGNHVISNQCLRHVACGCAQVVSELDRALSAQGYDPVILDNVRAQSREEFAHAALDISHIVSKEGANHVRSNTNHAPSE